MQGIQTEINDESHLKVMIANNREIRRREELILSPVTYHFTVFHLQTRKTFNMSSNKNPLFNKPISSTDVNFRIDSTAYCRSFGINFLK